jgi:hypothetical protein
MLKYLSMAEDIKTYGNYDYTADHMKATPEQLLALFNDASTKDLSTDQAMDLLEVVGLTQPLGQVEEFYEVTDTQDTEQLEPRQILLRGCAFALTAQATTGRLPYATCRKLVEDTIDEEPARHFFLSHLYDQEAMDEHDAEHNKAAIKLARRAITHAYKSGNIEAVITSKYKEVFILYHSKKPVDTAKKAQSLWDQFQAAENASQAAKNDELRTSLLTMWRSALVEAGQLQAGADVQQQMFEAGYVKETGEQFRARIIRDFVQYSHLRDSLS